MLGHKPELSDCVKKTTNTHTHTMIINRLFLLIFDGFFAYLPEILTGLFFFYYSEFLF